ncbi:MAG TPA: hypothetical protein VK633_12210, partial [Verrucomicrobiae bacterium]|nr:hypothetical protein [Verrucomicrobiae bacterium]
GTKAEELLELRLGLAHPGAGALATCVAPQTLVALPPQDEESLRKAVQEFFAASAEKQAAWTFNRRHEELLRNFEPACRAIVWGAYREAPIHAAAEQGYASNQVQYGKYLSHYTLKKVGSKPPEGWPLFIAMHGGGGAPKEVNDSQWKVMQKYYRDQTNVTGYAYLALRAPNDSWNGFYDTYVYPLIDTLIRQHTLYGEIDPNKVFLMGYSHGGYGAFAIGPKMPDHFAAIHSSAAAPTEGETTPKTLRHTRFTYMIGEKDHAYGRLSRCTNFDNAILKLRGERTDIYPVAMEYRAGFGHGGLPDRDKIADLYPAVRDPVPRDLTWEMTDNVITNFFWLRTSAPRKKRLIEATCLDNHIRVTTSTNLTQATVFLDSRLVDFQRPIVLELNGRSSTHQVEPSLKTFCQTLLERGDVNLAFAGRLDLDLAERNE